MTGSDRPFTSSGASGLRVVAPLATKVISGSGLPPLPGPALIKPTSSFVVLDAAAPLGVASPNQADGSVALIRADDLLVLGVTQYRNAANQVFLEFDFPSQHAAETTSPYSPFPSYTPPPPGQPSTQPGPYQSAATSVSAGPFGWSGDTLTPAAPVPSGRLSNIPLPPPTGVPIIQATLWWNDLTLPCTSVLMYLPGLVAGTFAAGQAPVDRGADWLLDWSSWSLCVTAGAASTALLQTSGASAPPPGDASEAFGSRLAMMFGMVFAQTELGAWTHVNRPLFGSTGRNELWHTRLVPRPPPDGTPPPQPTMRATYSLGEAIAGARATDLTGYLFPNNPFATNANPQLYDGLTPPADPTGGFALVYPGNSWVTQPASPLNAPTSAPGEMLMGDLISYTTYDPPRNVGMELTAEGVILSATGGSLRFAADFTGNPRLVTPDKLHYLSHEQVLGRDLSASGASIAILAPFGQPVILGTSFRRAIFDSAFAVLNEAESVHIIERAAQLPATTDFVQPFRSLRIVDAAFPPLHCYQATGVCYPLNAEGMPAVDAKGAPTNSPIIAHYEAIDAAGATIAFQLPLQVNIAGASAAAVTLELNQQRLAYSAAANSTFETESLLVSTEGGGFTVQQAVVHHPAISQFTGAEPITLLPPAQPGGDMLASVQSPAALDGTKTTDKYGAFAAPNMSLGVLSKSLGAAGAPPPPQDADPATLASAINGLFGGTLLLGVFSLADMMQEAFGAAGQVPLPGPKITSTNEAGVLTVSLDFETSGPNGQGLSVDLASVATLGVQAVSFNSTTTHGPSGAATTGTCLLTSPTIQIPAGANQLASFDFAAASFTASSAAKPTVSVDFNAIEFHGDLSFVNTIMAILPSSMFSNPPEVTITDSQCEIDCGVGIPSLGIGVFSLANINIDANLTIPFVADPSSPNQITFGFDFCTVDDPFTLSVMGFAGAGSFGITISPKAIGVDGSLAFGGDYDVSVIVAEGWVSLEAGVHITYTSDPTGSTQPDVDVGGFVHLSGGVEVLDLVSLTLDAMLTLTYDSAGNSFSGSASVTLGVDLTFYHTSVSFSVSETFTGAAPAASAPMELVVGTAGAALGKAIVGPRPADPFTPPPNFLAAVRPGDWASYCGAFAA